MVLVPIYGFIALRRRVKRRVLSKRRAFLYYAGIVIAPVVVYVIFFLGLVGLEEMSDGAIVSEGLARSVVILTGFGLVVWLLSLVVFGIALTFISF